MALPSRLDLAIEIARRAGKLTLEHFQRGIAFERKSDDSPVTVADRAAEQLLREAVRHAFPDDAIIGEEFGEHEGTSGYTWIFDPIDGTKSFISGVPLYGTMVGVQHEGRCPIGVVYIPGLDEMIYASTGNGAWHVKNGGEPVAAKVSDCSDMNDTLFVTSQVDTFAERGAGDAYLELEKKAYITRTWGDCYGYLLVATGRAGVMVDPMMNIWDAAAVQPIMEEAGGVFVDWQGNPKVDSGDGIGTTKTLLPHVLEVTRKFPPLS
jgi:histidinol-phosphatase